MVQGTRQRKSIAVVPRAGGGTKTWIQTVKSKKTSAGGAAKTNGSAALQQVLRPKSKPKPEDYVQTSLHRKAGFAVRQLPDSVKSTTEPPLVQFGQCETLKFGDLEVAFPYPPYPCQKAYMAHVASALLNGKNALLESPTGTGKTLCLLSVVLAWQYAISLGRVRNPKLDKTKTFTTAQVTAKCKMAGKEGAELITAGFDDLESHLAGFSAEPNETLAGGGAASSGVGKKVKSEALPRIFYASRTHSQLTQVVGELKKTPYYGLGVRHCTVTDDGRKEEKENESPDIEDAFKLRSVCLASRDHYCIHPEAMANSNLRGSGLNSWCKKQTSKKLCLWHSGCDAALKRGDLFGSSAFDVEGLRQIAQLGHPVHAPRPFCPFYAAREVQKTATLIFVPYNYLVHSGMRDRLGLTLGGDVIIIDEAHNLESTAEEATSFELNVHDAIGILRALERAPLVIRGPGDDGKVDKDGGERLTQADVDALKLYIPAFEKLLDHIVNVPLKPSPVNQEEKIMVQTLEEFQKSLNGLGLDSAATLSLQGLLRRLSLALESYGFEAEDNDPDAQTYLGLAIRVENVMNALAVVWSPEVTQSSKKFRAVITDGGQTEVQKRTSIVGDRFAQHVSCPRRLCFWSFAAHVALLPFFQDSGETLPCHSLIITSGTLKPLDAQELQLGASEIKFPVQLENEHVIEDKQLFTAIVGAGPQGSKMLMTYDSLKKDKGILDEVGHIVVDACRLIRRDGVLVFFPSYGQMNRCLDQWTRGSLMQSINSYKEVFVEPPDAQQAAAMIEDFKHVIEAQYGKKSGKRRSIRNQHAGHGTSGAVFFGVCRGRLSEGLSLSDELCRLVIVIGIPFPSVGDLRIAMKRQIFNVCPLASKHTRVDGASWYARQASMAVNQAAGRVVRHRHDYGAILFLDLRYGARDRMNELSGWIVKRLQSSQMAQAMPWTTVFERMTSFFNSQGNSTTSAKSSTSTAKLCVPPTEQQRTVVDKSTHDDKKPLPKEKVAQTTATSDESWAADLEAESDIHSNNESQPRSDQPKPAQTKSVQPKSAQPAITQPSKAPVRVTDFFSQRNQKYEANSKLAERVQSKLNLKNVRAALGAESRFGMRSASPALSSPLPTSTPELEAQVQRIPTWMRPVKPLTKPHTAIEPPCTQIETSEGSNSVCQVCFEDCVTETNCCGGKICKVCLKRSIRPQCPFCRADRFVLTGVGTNFKHS